MDAQDDIREDIWDGDSLSTFLDDAKAAEAVAERRRERRLAQLSAEEADLRSTFRFLSQAGHEVTLHTTTGRQYAGQIVGVARDAVELNTVETGRVLVRLPAVAWITSQPGRRAPSARHERSAAAEELPRLLDILATDAADRPRVRVFCGNAVLTGDLRSVGQDVIHLELDGAGQQSIINLEAVSELVIVTGV